MLMLSERFSQKVFSARLYVEKFFCSSFYFSLDLKNKTENAF